jgi:hypothetical protein
MSSNNDQYVDFGAFETDMTTQVAELQNELRAAKLEKDNLRKEKDDAVAVAPKALAEADAVAPGSVQKKVNCTDMHPTRHDSVVLAAVPALIAIKQLQNNHDAIWWCTKHIEALGVGDEPDWHDSYKKWASDHKNDALEKYIPFV